MWTRGKLESNSVKAGTGATVKTIQRGDTNMYLVHKALFASI